MFYCEECRLDRQWPESFSRSEGPCEICKKVAVCYDYPSSYLPLPAQKASGVDNPQTDVVE